MFAVEPDQVKRLLSGINLDSAFGKRDYLLILFLYHTGLRIGEACKLNVDFVALDGQPRDEIWLPYTITKGRRSRTVPLNSVAKKCVTKLLEFNTTRGFSTAAAAPLFPWKNHKPLPPREAQRMLQKLRQKVGLNDKVTPHTLRHSFASELVRHGVHLATVSSLLGHRKLSSTQIYTHTHTKDKQNAVERLVGSAH